MDNDFYTKGRLFDDYPYIRYLWRDDDWYYSIADVVVALTKTMEPLHVIERTKIIDKEMARNWSRISTPQIMLNRTDDKRRIMTANTAAILRFLMSMPHYSTDPYKLWLAINAKEELYASYDPMWNTRPQIFAQSHHIRCVIHNDDWFYSIQDVVAHLADARNPLGYVQLLKKTHPELAEHWNKICTLLVMPDDNGVKRRIMAADTMHTYLLITYILHRKAESYKQWMCQVASAALEEPYTTSVLHQIKRNHPALPHI